MVGPPLLSIGCRTERSGEKIWVEDGLPEKLKENQSISRNKVKGERVWVMVAVVILYVMR